MAKKIIEAVKKSVKKPVAKKVEKKEVKVKVEEVVKAVPVTCTDCKGGGLSTPQTLCFACSGSGTI